MVTISGSPTRITSFPGIGIAARGGTQPVAARLVQRVSARDPEELAHIRRCRRRCDVDDIVSRGDDRDPGHRTGWRRSLLVAAFVAVAAVIVVEHVPHGRHADHRLGSASITRSGQRSGAGPASSAAPDGIIGPSVPFGDRIKLPRTGIRPSWFWPATGRVQVIGGLPANYSGYMFTRLNGGWAVAPASVDPVSCSGCIGLPVPVYYLADDAWSAEAVGTADQVAPAVGVGAMWLTTYATNVDPRAIGGTAREVSGTGRTVIPPISLPVGYEIDQATSRGLLLAPIIGGPRPARYLLWSPARARRIFTDVIAASAGAIAWLPRCAATCLVHVLDLATGKVTLVSPPAGNSVIDAVFRPDGRYLALGVSFGFKDGDLTIELEVVRVRTGRVQVVPGTWVSSDAMVGFGWPYGDELVAELSFATKVQVVSWSLGAARLAVARIRSLQNPTALVLR